MIKLSVKKPFTVFVAVIAALLIAVVSLSKLQADLLPEFSTPYLLVITTYPGASPEKVEAEVTEVVESSLSTINHVKTYTSNSAENYSLTMLEFDEDTDMDAALVKVYTGIEEIKDKLPDLAGSPSVMEITMDMLATMYATVSMDDADIYKVSSMVDEDIVPYLQRQPGVGSVSTLGIVDQTVEVRLNEEKIEKLNDDLADTIAEKLDDARNELSDAKEEINSGKSKLNSSESSLKSQQEGTSEELAKYTKQLNEALATKSAYEAALSSLKASKVALTAEKKAYEKAGVKESYAQMNEMFSQLKSALEDEATQSYLGLSPSDIPSDVEDALDNPEKLDNAITVLKSTGQEEAASALTADTLGQLADAIKRLDEIDTELANLKTEINANKAMLKQVKSAIDEALENYESVEEGKMTASASFGSGQAAITSGKEKLDEAQAELDEALEKYEESRDAALKAANLDGLLTLDTLSSLIYAQDFSMPAGYIDDEDDSQWLLKVGSEVESVQELKNLPLTHIDNLGTITVDDVADVTLIDNSEDSYARMNGEQAVVLSVYKSSSAGTSKVASTVNEAFDKLQSENEGLHIDVMMDQGEYMDMFLSNILSNMLWGAGLAMVVLALFLRRISPTLIVAFSIPFSVLVAVLIMYFTGISLNIMSMSGLALGIGMLVDNSIVVVENIYRLRGRGTSPARAAYRGAKQVASAIISSTLTTVCVFLPMIFTTGTVRELMVSFALTITFSLGASLLVALTVVPSMGSLMLKKNIPSATSLTKKIQKGYGRLLGFFLRFKIIPIGLAVALFAMAISQVPGMGLVLIPDSGSNQIFVQVTMDDDVTKQEAYEKADAISDKILAVGDIEKVGAMANLTGLFSAAASESDDYSEISFYIILNEDITDSGEIRKIKDDVTAALEDETECTVEVSESGSGDLSSFTSSGLTMYLYGSDTEVLSGVAKDLCEITSSIDGFTDVSDGSEDPDETLHLTIDRKKAAKLGLTVAQVYSDITDKITTDKTATTLDIDGDVLDVSIVDERDELTREDLLDMKVEVESTDDEGNTTTKKYKLSKFASVEVEETPSVIMAENGTHMMEITADVADGYNTTRLSDKLSEKLEEYAFPDGYTYSFGGEVEDVSDMITQMAQLLLLGFFLIYLVMVAQFQSLLSPFIIIFTVPLAFTGGMLGLLIFGEQISIVSLLGFLVLMGTVVNNGIVFVDYVNQLRLGGMEKRPALIAAGQTRMRPILMTTFTTVLAMGTMVVSNDVSASLSRGMAIVVSFGLIYATLMTLFIEPVMYDILFRKKPHAVDIGEDMEDELDDAGEYLREHMQEQEE